MRMRVRTFSIPIGASFLGAALSTSAVAAQSPAPGESAAAIMAQARNKAKAENKNILLDFSASWCGNCHLFEKFLADPAIHPIMDKAFVMTTVVSGERPGDPRHANTPGGPQFEATLGGKDAGFPYIVMLNPEGQPIVDSYRPVTNKAAKANIGYPDLLVEVDWFMEMLQKAAPSLSPPERTTVHNWLTQHGHSR